MAIAKGIKKILKSVKSKKTNKNELKNLNPEKLAKIEEQVAKNVTPLLASALGLTFAKGQVERMKGGGVAGNFAKGVGKGAKAAARGLYRAKTGPLQVASAISSAIAPSSKLTAALNKAARPFKKGGVASSKSKSSGVALKGFGKEIK